MMNKKTILMVANVDWTFIVHRMDIAKEALRAGYEVVVLAKDTGRSSEIIKEGMSFYNLEITRSGTNLFKEVGSLCRMFNLYKKIKPDIVYHVTMKPVIYGTLISKILKLNTVNGISGLGYNFTSNRQTKVQKVMTLLMRYVFNKHNNALVFENHDDFEELSSFGIISNKNKVIFTKGVGVDLKKFKPIERETKNEKVVVLLPTRMLWDKGVKEYIEAAYLLKNEFFGKVLFRLCGQIDKGNIEAIPKSFLNENKVEGFLEWVGYKGEMIFEYQEADIVVLPSYREGLPTVLLEACAVGLPIVTTNAIGCKDCVEEGKNGYKVPVKAVKELAVAIKKLIDSPSDRKRMGSYSRKKAVKEFDQQDVINKHLDIYNSMSQL